MNPGPKPFTEGRLYGGYTVSFEPWAGSDFTRRCFLFPGQGSASPGMFKSELGSVPSFRKRFDTADSFAARSGLGAVSRFCLEPDKIDRSQEHLLRNLALFTSSVALFDLALMKMLVPEVVTGHSFGEFAALVAAGICSFDDMLSIVLQRDLLSPSPGSVGTMIAVSGARADVETALAGESFYVSNLNSPDQVVISCAIDRLVAVREALKRHRIASKVLAEVPQPYHTPLLEPVRERLSAWMAEQDFEFRPPAIPLFSSVSGRMVTREGFSRALIRGLIADQLVRPVDFVTQVGAIHDGGCRNFLELGPATHCTLLVRNILRGREFKVAGAERLLRGRSHERKARGGAGLEGEKGRLFKVISGVVNAVAGYRLEDISIEDKFQEDLGIDSIKKAEIFFQVMRNSGIAAEDLLDDGSFSLSRISTIDDVARFLETSEKMARTAAEKSRGEKKAAVFDRCVEDEIALPRSRIGAEGPGATGGKHLEVRLSDLIHPEGKALQGMTREFLAGSGSVLTLVDVASEAAADPCGEEAVACIQAVIGWARELTASIPARSAGEGSGRAIALVTRGSASWVGALPAFFKSLKVETGKFFFKHIELAPGVASGDLESLVRAELGDPSTSEIRIRPGGRHGISMKKVEASAGSVTVEGEVWVAIGGARGITRSLLRNLAPRFRPKVHVLGRTPAGDPALEKDLEGLRAVLPGLEYHGVDATDGVSLRGAISEILAREGRIDLLINAAGSERSRLLKDKSDAEVQSELRSKILSTDHCLEIARESGIGRVHVFSSIVSRYGNQGQAAYAAANEYIAGRVARHNRMEGPGRALSIHWPPWDAVGMTESIGVRHSLRRAGFALLPEERAAEFYRKELLGSGSTPESSVYYVESASIPATESLLFDREQLAALLDGVPGVNTRIALPRISLSRQPYLRDHYIVDHMAQGFESRAFLYPGSSAIALFLCAARFHFKRFPALHRFSAQNMLVVEEERSGSHLDSSLQDGILKLRIQGAVQNFSADAAVDRSPAPQAAPEFRANREVDMDTYYTWNALDLGPAFRVAESMWTDQKGDVLMRVRPSVLPPYLGIPEFDMLGRIAEAAVQSLGARSVIERRGFTVPLSIERLRVFEDRDFSGDLLVLSRMTGESGKNLIGDVRVLNSAGETLMTLDGLVVSVFAPVTGLCRVVTRDSDFRPFGGT